MQKEQPDRNSTVGYVVSAWPRLSQTFVLTEIIALERLAATADFLHQGSGRGTDTRERSPGTLQGDLSFVVAPLETHYGRQSFVGLFPAPALFQESAAGPALSAPGCG